MVPSMPREGLTRRTVLGALSTAGAMSLAGCGGGGGNGNGGITASDGELGERVPTLTAQHYSGWYQKENAAQILSQQLPERLGIEVEASAIDTLTLVGNLSNDSRTSSIPLYYLSVDTDGAFAHERLTAEKAGSAGPNQSQYTNCRYSALMHGQRRVPDTDQRVEVMNHAQSIMSNDLGAINLGIPFDNRWAYRTDQLSFNEDRAGIGSLYPTNTRMWTTFETVGDTERLEIANDQGFLYSNQIPYSVSSPVGQWNNQIHSRLFYQDENLEFMNGDLAESVEVSDDGLEYTVQLVDDATFHNGDPVTAEDVKFSYEWLIANPGFFFEAPRTTYEVEVVDETTARFNLDEPYSPLVLRDFHTWGILHRDTWVDAGALENAQEARPSGEEMVGSGPYEITSFTAQEGLTMEPYTDHHHWDPDPSASIGMNVYSDVTSIFSALQAGDIVAGPVRPPQQEQIEASEDNNIQVIQGSSSTALQLMPQHSMAPTKFSEFREALAMAINYQEIENLVTLGYREPDIYAGVASKSFPFRAPDDMLYEQGNGNVAGDPEAARQLLEEAGWGYDEDGMLHYPVDADLSPPWEAEGTPDPDDYPCLKEGEEGDPQYVQPDLEELDLPVDLDEYMI